MMKLKQVGWIVLGLLLWESVSAIDSELYKRYQTYKSRQQSQQVEELSLARSAANAGDFKKAERHLETARNMAYSPDEIRSVENLITEERQRRVRLAEQERKRKEQLAEQEMRAKEKVARAAASGEAGSSGLASIGVVEHELNWGYNYKSIYIPPTYKTELERKDIFSSKYHWVTSQDFPGYTKTNLDNLYFSVKLKNNSNRNVRVRYKISAREKVSIRRAVGNIKDTAIFAIGGAGLAHWLGEDPEVGAALGAGYMLSEQESNNRWFNKEKTFTTTLGPNEETYESGRFPVNKTVSESPTLEILSVGNDD